MAINPAAAKSLLDGLGGALAKRLSSSDLTLGASPSLIQHYDDPAAPLPRVEPASAEAYITTLAPEGRSDAPQCGYLCIGIAEGPHESFWGYFWGFVGPLEEPHISEFRKLGKGKRLRQEVWDIQAEIPARGMLRWFGIPDQGPDHFVEIKSFGTLGAQVAGWVREFTPAAVLMDLPNDLLMPASQRALPQLIGADLERLLPLLRVCNGLPARAPNQQDSPYPLEMPDPRRRRPVLFLSYSRKDDVPEGKGLVSQLYRAIESRQPGIAFLDSGGLKAGDDWEKVIERKLSETAVLVVLVSGNSLESVEVGKEFTQFVHKLSDETWPGLVIPVPIDAESFEFFRTRSAAGEESWWNTGTTGEGGNPAPMGLASFNFERDSLSDLGPDRMAEKLLAVYGEYRDKVQEQLSRTHA